MTRKSKDAEPQRPEVPAVNSVAVGAAFIAFGEGVLKELSGLGIQIAAYRNLRAQLDVLKEHQARVEAHAAAFESAPAEPAEPAEPQTSAPSDQTTLQV